METIFIIWIFIMIVIPVIDNITWDIEQKKKEKKWQEWIKKVNSEGSQTTEISCGYLNKSQKK